MPGKPIQEQFGEHVIDAFATFARADIRTPDELEAAEFSHVSDASLRQALAQVFYGVRWIYKLGLALLTVKEERADDVARQDRIPEPVKEGIWDNHADHSGNEEMESDASVATAGTGTIPTLKG